MPCGLVANGAVTVGKANACLIRSGATSDWLFARGQATLADKPIAWATLYATASSPVPTRQYVYKMYVNGHYVGLGPTQSIGSETRYDGYGVTSDLVSGQSNAIGALLYTTSDHRFLAKLVVHSPTAPSRTSERRPRGRRSRPLGVPGGRQHGHAVLHRSRTRTSTPPTARSASRQRRTTTAGWDPAQAQAAYANLEATPTGKVDQSYQPPT